MYHNIKHETSNVPSFMSYLSSISTIPSIPSIPSASTTIDIADKENFYTTTNDDSLSLRETCKECKKSFKCPIKFRNLAKNSHNHEWICLFCCLTYKSRGARDFPCVLCEKKCYESYGLRQHFDAKHPGKEFPSILLRIPVTASISCDHCSSVFFERRYQRRHMNKEHHGEKSYPHTCPHCQTRFPTQKRLKHHNCRKYQTDATSQPTSQSTSQPTSQPTSQSTLQSTLDDEQSKVKNDLRYQMYNKHPMITRSKRKYRAFVYLKKYGSLDDEKYRKKKPKNDVNELEEMEVNYGDSDYMIKREDGGDSNMSRIKREDDGDSNMSRIKREDDGDSDMSRIKRENDGDSNMSGIKRESDNNPDYMQRIKYEDDRGSSYLPRIKQEDNNYYMSNIKREDTYMPIIKRER